MLAPSPVWKASAGAFSGFAAACLTGDPLIGLAVAIVVGLLAGAVMGLLTVTLGANQHVSGLGLTIVHAIVRA